MIITRLARLTRLTYKAYMFGKATKDFRAKTI